MALNTGINSLDAGAPDIKYTGTEGPQDPRTAGVSDYLQYVQAMHALNQDPMPIDIFHSLEGIMSLQDMVNMGSPEKRAQGGRIGYANGGLKNIQGKDHMLAYITPGEASSLQNMGGQKVMTPEGIFAYPPPGERGGGGYMGGGGGGGNGHAHPGIASTYSAPAPAPAPPGEKGGPGYVTPQEKREQDKARDEERAKIREEARTKKAPKTKTTPKAERVPDFVKQIIAPPVTPKDERVPDFVKDIIEPKIDIGFQEELRKQKIARDLKIKQQDPRYGQFFRPTPVVEKPQGIMSSLLGKGKNIAGNMAKQFALSKLGLGFLNPFVGIASLFGFDPIGSLMANMANMSKGPGTKTTGQLDDIRGGGDGQVQAPANVIQASIQKFRPTDQQTSQMAEIQRKRDILQGYADKKGLNEQGMNTLAQMNQLISQYQADPRSIYG